MGSGKYIQSEFPSQSVAVENSEDRFLQRTLHPPVIETPSGDRPAIADTNVLFPQPDSPTMPKVELG